MLLFRGLTLVVLEGATVGGLPDGFKKIGNGFLPEIGPDTGLHNLTMILAVVVVARPGVPRLPQAGGVEALQLRGPAVRRCSSLKQVVLGAVIMEFSYLLADARGLPIVGLILFALIAIYTFIMNRTVFGRHVYAIGGNVDAATMSGVNTKRVDFLVMTNMGLLAGLAGLVTTARLTAANPKAGVNFELDAIAAAFIGGAAVTGGVGTVIGAIIGGLVMGVLNNGMSLKGVVHRLAAGDQGPGAAGRRRLRRVEQEAHRRRPVVRARRQPSPRRHRPTSSNRRSMRSMSVSACLDRTRRRPTPPTAPPRPDPSGPRSSPTPPRILAGSGHSR